MGKVIPSRNVTRGESWSVAFGPNCQLLIYFLYGKSDGVGMILEWRSALSLLGKVHKIMKQKTLLVTFKDETTFGDWTTGYL